MQKWTGILLLVISFSAAAQDLSIKPAFLQGYWPAEWISCPGISQRAYGVFHFRKSLQLSAPPASLIVHISADNRYRLFVNGKPVAAGPAKGDLAHWFFETIDIAPFLHAGKNTLAAAVWNMGEFAAVSQISNQTAFILQADDTAYAQLNSGKEWKVLHDTAYRPCALPGELHLNAYFVIGPGDDVQAAAYPWNWEKTDYDDSNWPSATPIAKGVPTGYGSDNIWTLVPRSIPPMEERLQRIQSVRRVSGRSPSPDFISGKHPLTIAAHDSLTILLDQGFNTVAYPELWVNGGAGSSVRITYAEALFDTTGQKGNRNTIDGKKILGNYDVYHPDGGQHRLFRPLWFRTFRYIQLDIHSGSQPLTIEDFYGVYTGYPFKEQASFASNDSSLQPIWKTGWRTARLCGGENYFDCPYYEQLQYEADTRIQSLISLYVSGDDRLMRKAITDFYNSRVSEGLTQGRYPSNRLQVIPPFSLFYISMVYDYWMHRKDDDFIRPHLVAIRGILDWYEKRIDNDKKILGPMRWWNFVDWNNHFDGGVPDGADDGNSSIISLQLACTLRQAAALMDYFNYPADADHYTSTAASLATHVYASCFDPAKGLMANTPEKKSFSQHASIFAVLASSIPAADQAAVMEKVLKDTSISQATFYFRFYLNQALKKAGLGDLYYAQLKPWRDMLSNGLTTFAENPDPTRSDCHAWSASPVYDFLATLCGIVPDAPGFSRIRIAPNPGSLTHLRGKMPHPAGWIVVDLQRKGATGMHAEITLPKNSSGIFVWHQKEIPLREGMQTIEL